MDRGYDQPPTAPACSHCITQCSASCTRSRRTAGRAAGGTPAAGRRSTSAHGHDVRPDLVAEGSQDCHVGVFYASRLASGVRDCALDTSRSSDDGGGRRAGGRRHHRVRRRRRSSRGRVTVLQLTWRSCDPLAVTMELVSRPEHPALPRASGWRHGTHCAPGSTSARRRRRRTDPAEAMRRRRPAGVRLDLSDGDRQSVVLLEAAPLRSFLDRTGRVVRPARSIPNTQPARAHRPLGAAPAGAASAPAAVATAPRSLRPSAGTRREPDQAEPRPSAWTSFVGRCQLADAAAARLGPGCSPAGRPARHGPARSPRTPRNAAVWLPGPPPRSPPASPPRRPVPPPEPPSGPRSTTQSAVLMTSRLCSMTSTVLPLSTSRPARRGACGCPRSAGRSSARRGRRWCGRWSGAAARWRASPAAPRRRTASAPAGRAGRSPARRRPGCAGGGRSAGRRRRTPRPPRSACRAPRRWSCPCSAPRASPGCSGRRGTPRTARRRPAGSSSRS